MSYNNCRTEYAYMVTPVSKFTCTCGTKKLSLSDVGFSIDYMRIDDWVYIIFLTGRCVSS